MRKIIVQKFGGTSVADTDKIKNVADIVLREKQNGNDVVVVVSAMGHTTDMLTKPTTREKFIWCRTSLGL